MAHVLGIRLRGNGGKKRNSARGLCTVGYKFLLVRYIAIIYSSINIYYDGVLLKNGQLFFSI